ncbi:restriction endonuclease [Methylobacterium sp. B4]|uniref:restriction endonuclease n=1 Tax=Methylobacterium sp. B4 TaxID=1938755 RepID=UPI0015E8B018|nr:restriction endonuclease [Methylobacterium sp. B4]
MPDLPTSVRYVKNGAGGRWWPDAKSRSGLHAGWSRVPDEMLRATDLSAIAAILREQYGLKPGATQDLNALRSLLESPSRHLWVTFEDGFMWWSTVRDGITISPDNETVEHGHFWLDLDRPWSNRSLTGRYLAMSELPGVVTTTAGFQGTICEPKGWREILCLIRDEEDEEAAAAIAAQLAYQAAVGKLVARLRPKDFEVLVDLILSRSGWTRLAKLGGATEGIDVEVENPATDEIAFVQVKAAAGQKTLDDYVGRFRERRERYHRMIFAVHSPKGSLAAPPGEPVQVWDGPKVAKLVVRLGLGDWLVKRI